MKTEPAPSILARPAVTRTGVDRVTIAWDFIGEPVEVSIFQGASPQAIDRRSAVARTRSVGVTVTGLSPDTPHYFELRPSGGRPLVVGERRIPAEGTSNLRDLGGYPSLNGRRVKWGTIYRSSQLGRLTENGLARIRSLGIRLVCDLRTDTEAAKFPNRFPDSPEVAYLRLSIQHGDFEPTAAFDRIKQGDCDWISEEFMLQGYIESLERYAHVWASLFQRLSEPPSRPLLFHCAGGKDRTGTGAALILLALGVPAETVIADYGLSDAYNAEVRRGIYDQLRPFGVDVARLEPYFTAPESRIRALLSHIDDRYGSAVGYLVQKAGVREETIARLKDELLE